MGVSATPLGANGQGLRGQYDALVQGPPVAELIRRGFLADYDYFLPSPGFSMAGVGVQAGDFRVGEALAAMSKARIVGDAVAHYRTHLGDRPAIAFCLGVQHCREVAAMFAQAGVPSAHVDGDMPPEVRAARLADLAGGRIRLLAAADVISEGLDIPGVAGAILLRPTMSLVLQMQQCGRALRPKPGGGRATILDHVGNARRHGFPADPRTWSLDATRPRAKPEVAVRECSRCARVFAVGAPAGTPAGCAATGCPILAPPVATPRSILSTEGTLEAVGDPWAWALGIDPSRATGAEFAALLEHAGSDEARLKQVQRARGYHHRWVIHRLGGGHRHPRRS